MMMVITLMVVVMMLMMVVSSGDDDDDGWFDLVIKLKIHDPWTIILAEVNVIDAPEVNNWLTWS